MKSLDSKLKALNSDPAASEFIICYAADPDMAGGLAPNVDKGVTRAEWHEEIATMVDEGNIDMLLASVSTMDYLARDRRIFDDSPVTPATRANDTTDIWFVRGGTYSNGPSRPFATTTVKEAMYGTLHPEPDQAVDVPIGLWSVTFNNDLEADERSLQRYRDFRQEAAAEGFRHFLEVFNPNVDPGLDGPLGAYVNDCIARMLAGVPRTSRPEFLKVAYNGPDELEELASGLDVVVGVLGGPPGTANDTFTLVQQVKKHGGRLALFGRRIKMVDDSKLFTELLREVADTDLAPEEATRAYHSRLAAAGITPMRSLDEDLVVHTPELLDG